MMLKLIPKIGRHTLNEKEGIETVIRALYAVGVTVIYQPNINKMNIKKYGSQGQQRSAILSIKLAEIEIIKHTSGYSPILLLDDVFSELDKDRRSRLMEIISNVQALITTNDIDFDITKNMTLYTVKEGRILK